MNTYRTRFLDTDCKDTNSVEEEINEKLIYHGKEDKIKPSYAKKVLATLLTEAFVVATQKDNRKLTKARFLEFLKSKQQSELQYSRLYNHNN